MSENLDAAGLVPRPWIIGAGIGADESPLEEVIVKPGEVTGPELLNDIRVQNRSLVNQLGAILHIEGAIDEPSLAERLYLRPGHGRDTTTFRRVINYAVKGGLAAYADKKGKQLVPTSELQAAAAHPKAYPELATYIGLITGK